MSVVFCGICPHPPVAVPEVGRRESEEVQKTREALLELGRRLKKSSAETVVIISPHAPIFHGLIGLNGEPVLSGDLASFGACEVKFQLDNDPALVREIKNQAAALGLSAMELTGELAGQYDFSLRLDHGVTVPLYFLQQAGVNLPLVHVSMALDVAERLYLFGLAVRKAAELTGRRAALLASGDLSHCLTRLAPAGYNPKGAEFDRKLARLLAVPDVQGIMQMDDFLVQEAAECGYRSILMMLGALDGLEVEAEVLSYEGPFGVGYLVASFIPGPANPERSLLKKIEAGRQARLERRRAAESFLVRVARETMEEQLNLRPQSKDRFVPEEFDKKAGVFVSIKKHGSLRGCIGTIEPAGRNIVEEVVKNAVSAAFHDPRFKPVRREELEDLEFSVDVLQPPEPVSGLNELDPQKYGVIVRSGRRSGLLLPNLEGIDSAGEQVEIARRKAGIGPEEPVALERFEVVRYY